MKSLKRGGKKVNKTERKGKKFTNRKKGKENTQTER
jgi:hypothetical protein